MASLSSKLSKLVADRCLAPRKPAPLPVNEIQPPSENLLPLAVPDLPLDFDFESTDFLSGQDAFDLSTFLDQTSDQSQDTASDNKRKPCDDHGVYSDHWKRAKAEPDLLDNLDSLFFPDFNPGLQERDFLSCDDYRSSPGCSENSAVELGTFQRGGSVDSVDPTSSHSDVSGVSCPEESAEYHFKEIQRHVELAVGALRRGHYQRSKSIVTWAHELKNKTVSELKKEAELAWEADKDKEGTYSRPVVKKQVHSATKRVEQFRKNMRRWMIGTQAHQVGVEWMVYARMEHLLAISKFILGDTMPADPASPTAVAESISTYLGQQLAAEFVDHELAEPEPGKRYVIGQGLVPHLQARCHRKVPTLAFTMPADGDSSAMADWLARLRALFPAKPLSKRKALVAPKP